jgi:hypothetical protein
LKWCAFGVPFATINWTEAIVLAHCNVVTKFWLRIEEALPPISTWSYCC